MYTGYARPGAADDEPVWLIQRVTILPDRTARREHPDGAATFDRRWTERADLTYR